MIDQALATLEQWFYAGLHVLHAFLVLIDHALHQALDRLGVPASSDQILLLIVNIVLIVLVFRVFGGAIRLLLIVFFVLLLLHALAPDLGA